MVTFTLDCSFSIDEALEQAGIPRRDPAGPSHAGAYKVRPHLRQNGLKKWMELCFPVLERTLEQEAEALRLAPAQ